MRDDDITSCPVGPAGDDVDFIDRTMVRWPLMKILLSACCIMFLCGLALAWWLRSADPAVGIGIDDARASDVPRGLPVNPATDTRNRGPLTWIPTDSERPDDRGAFLTWVPTDAERVDDDGASRTWIASDAERDVDDGASRTWTATDAERDDDVGVQVRDFASNHATTSRLGG
jgi:hypothetical protein